jgi:hypothetical protein
MNELTQDIALVCRKFGYDAYMTVSAFPIRASLHIADAQACKVRVDKGRYRRFSDYLMSRRSSVLAFVSADHPKSLKR